MSCGAQLDQTHCLLKFIIPKTLFSSDPWLPCLGLQQQKVGPRQSASEDHYFDSNSVLPASHLVSRPIRRPRIPELYGCIKYRPRRPRVSSPTGWSHSLVPTCVILPTHYSKNTTYANGPGYKLLKVTPGMESWNARKQVGETHRQSQTGLTEDSGGLCLPPPRPLILQNEPNSTH